MKPTQSIASPTDYTEICRALCAQYGLTYDPADPTGPRVYPNYAAHDALLVWPAGPTGWAYFFPYHDDHDAIDAPYTGLADMHDVNDLLPDDAAGFFTLACNGPDSTHITFEPYND